MGCLWESASGSYGSFYAGKLHLYTDRWVSDALAWSRFMLRYRPKPIWHRRKQSRTRQLQSRLYSAIAV